MVSKQVHFVNRQKGIEKTFYPDAVKTTKFKETWEEPSSTDIVKSTKITEIVKTVSPPPSPPSTTAVVKTTRVERIPQAPPSPASTASSSSFYSSRSSNRLSSPNTPNSSPLPPPAPPSVPSAPASIKSHVRTSPVSSTGPDSLRHKVQTSSFTTSQDAINYIAEKTASVKPESLVLRRKSSVKPTPPPQEAPKAPPSKALTAPLPCAPDPPAQKQPASSTVTVYKIPSRPTARPLQPPSAPDYTFSRTTTYSYRNETIYSTEDLSEEDFSSGRTSPATKTIDLPPTSGSLRSTALTIDTRDMSVLARIATAKVVMLPNSGADIASPTTSQRSPTSNGPKVVEIKSSSDRKREDGSKERRREERRYLERGEERRSSRVEYDRDVGFVRERSEREERRGSATSAVAVAARRGSREERNAQGKVVLIVG